jgi:hypothetical protein
MLVMLATHLLHLRMKAVESGQAFARSTVMSTPRVLLQHLGVPRPHNPTIFSPVPLRVNFPPSTPNCFRSFPSHATYAVLVAGHVEH